MTYYYKKLPICYCYDAKDFDPEDVKRIKNDYLTEKYNSYIWIICNSSTGKTMSADCGGWQPHTFIKNMILTNPHLISPNDFMDATNNPFRIKKHYDIYSGLDLYTRPYPVQTIKLKGKYEKLLSRT